MKKRQRFLLLICAALALAIEEIHAIEITGTVRAVNGETITVATAGDNVPNVGDKAEIFFKLAGVEGDISVASGSVLRIDGDSIQVKIEKATGEVGKDQLVRISSEKPQKRARPSDLVDAEKSYELGLNYFRGGGTVLIDHKKCFEHFEKAAEQGLPEAQARLAELWSSRGFSDFLHAADPDKAAELGKRALAGGLEARAKAGKHQSEYELGSLHLYGAGVTKDEAKAAELFERASTHGNKDAKRALGFLYLTGAGVTKDVRLAERYFKEAAAEKVASAQVFLGMLYSGAWKEASKSPEKAVEMFQAAAKQNLPSAQEKLGECFEKGEGVPQNLAKAVELYQTAADRGLWSALQKLGEMYEQGRGVPKDLAKAAEFYQKVADQDIKQGKDALERLRAGRPLSPSPSSVPK